MSEEILTDAVLTGIQEALKQFAVLVEKSADYAEDRGSKEVDPAKQLYWGGFVEGLRTAAQMATEVRPLRGIK